MAQDSEAKTRGLPRAGAVSDANKNDTTGASSKEPPPATKKWWISCPHATGQVDTTPERPWIIVAVPPIWGKFHCQELFRLVGWLTHKFGSCRQEEL